MSERIRATSLGMAPALAATLCMGPVQTGLTATGSTSQSGSYPLTQGGGYVFSTVNSGNGARLPYPADQNVGPIWVFNGGSNALLLYPASGNTINASAADASFSVTNGKGAFCYPLTTGWMVNLSA